MRMGLVAAALVPLTFVAFPVQAQERAALMPASAVASTASGQIARGAYDRAEQKLLTQLRLHPDAPELLLNLAVVYAKTGRTTEARALYGKVLSQEEVLMDIAADRTAGSYAIARAGLRQIDAVRFTAR